MPLKSACSLFVLMKGLCLHEYCIPVFSLLSLPYKGELRAYEITMLYVCTCVLSSTSEPGGRFLLNNYIITDNSRDMPFNFPQDCADEVTLY